MYAQTFIYIFVYIYIYVQFTRTRSSPHMHTYVIQSNNFAWHVLMSRHRIHNRAHFDSYKTRLLHVSSVYFLCTVQIEKNRKHIQTVDYFIIHNRISYLNFATHGYALDATPQIYHNHKCKHCGKWKLTANISFFRGISHIKRHVIPTFIHGLLYLII